MTPYGSTNYSQTGSYTDPTTGQVIPQYTQTTTLTPLEQSLLTGSEDLQQGQQGLQGQQQILQAGVLGTAQNLLPIGNNLVNTIGTNSTGNLNLGGANNNIIQGGPQAIDQSATNAIYQGEQALMQPGQQEQQTQLQDQLSRQGIPVGSDAYNNAEKQLMTTQNAANLGALGQATGQGITAANNLFNMALQGQQQGVNQQIQQQTLPITLLSQLYGGATGAVG